MHAETYEAQPDLLAIILPPMPPSAAWPARRFRPSQPEFAAQATLTIGNNPDMKRARLHPERAVGASECPINLMQGERNAARLALRRGARRPTGSGAGRARVGVPARLCPLSVASGL